MVPQSNPQNTGASGEDDIFASIMDLDAGGGDINISMDDDIMADVDDSLTPNATPKPDNKGNQEDWEQRYKDSSKEGIRLNGIVEKMSPYMPVLDMLSKDDGFKEHVMNYGKQTKTETLPEKLNLPEDFEFDMNEAIRNPDSEHAKILSQVSQHYAKPVINQSILDDNQKRAEEIKKEDLSNQRDMLKSKYGIKDTEFSSLMDWGNDHIMTYEDMHFLKKKDDYMRKVANDTKMGTANQVNRMQGVYPSVTVGDGQDEKIEDKIMDTILGFDKGQSLFND